MSNEKPFINHVLARWLSPPENLAPVLDCAGCSRATHDPAHAQRWRRFKCCAFQPYVANFLCGAMLEARIPLREMSARYVFQPIGLIPIAEFRARCESTPDENRDESHLCSFYDRGKCSIWNFRPGECSFYFCTPDIKPKEWSEKAFALESGLAQMALSDLNFSAEDISSQVDWLNSPPQSLQSLSLREAEEIYRASWEYAKVQSRNTVASWLGNG